MNVYCVLHRMLCIVYCALHTFSTQHKLCSEQLKNGTVQQGIEQEGKIKAGKEHTVVKQVHIKMTLCVETRHQEIAGK